MVMCWKHMTRRPKFAIRWPKRRTSKPRALMRLRRKGDRVPPIYVGWVQNLEGWLESTSVFWKAKVVKKRRVQGGPGMPRKRQYRKRIPTIEIVCLYVGGLSARDVAKRLGCGKTTVTRRLQHAGISARSLYGNASGQVPGAKEPPVPRRRYRR